MIYKNIQKNRGYTLLFAVLVSALVLSVGISILNISKKEFLLSSSARESTTAFYSADSGIECASYFDEVKGLFSNSNEDFSGMTCATHNISNQNHTSVSGVDTYTFDINLSEPGVVNTDNGPCASIVVTKAIHETDIDSRGYNIGWNSRDFKCNLAGPRRVERSLRYTYKY